MKVKKQFLISLVAVFVMVLSACGNTSDETNQKPSDMNQAQEEHKNSSDEETDAAGKKKPADSGEGESNGQDEAAGEEEATEDPEQQKPSEKKQEYLKKLEQAKKEAERLNASNEDTTVALKKKAEDRLKLWDELLNDIYGVLKGQLPEEEMKELQIEQRNWLVHRDDTALKASEKYKGGTAEQLEYVMVLANLTEQRCYELVNTYMR